jgi:ribbon-helix-helix CopG family protein
MVKTTVYLDDSVLRSLRTMSQREAKSQAQLIREALREFTCSLKPPLPAGMGAFDSGFTNTTSRRKNLLKSAARSGRWRS